MGPVAITVRVMGVVLVVVLVLVLLWLLRGLVLNTFLALLFAAGLLPAARRFERSMPRPAAAITVNVVVIGAMIGIILLAARPALEAIVIRGGNPGHRRLVRAWLEGLIGSDAFDQLFADEVDLTFILGGLLDLTVGAIVVLANVVVIVIIEIFLLIERRHLLDGMLEFMDTEDRPATRYILRTGIESLGKYLQGLFVSMAFIGVATAVGMAHQDPVRDTDGHHRVLHRRHPLHRRTVCLIPILLIAAAEVGPAAVLLMIVWQIIIQQIEGSFITPTVRSRPSTSRHWWSCWA